MMRRFLLGIVLGGGLLSFVSMFVGTIDLREWPRMALATLSISADSEPQYDAIIGDIGEDGWQAINLDELLPSRGNKYRVIIVPGHDNFSVGTSYKSVKEADLNLELAYDLYQKLVADPRIDAIVSRERDGSNAFWLRHYINKNKSAIEEFRLSSRERFYQLIADGVITRVKKFNHNNASPFGTTLLYALNKFANERDVDLVFHIHFNDYRGRKQSQRGVHNGFVIYVPEAQLPNSADSITLANYIRPKIESLVPVSSIPLDRDGVVENQELIAIGSNASRDGASMLVEYGFIYEPEVANSATRSNHLESLAELTYQGISDYLDHN